MSVAIGIDGGGTKTLGILADSAGRVLACAEQGATNHQICGAQAAGRRLAALTETLLQTAGTQAREVGHLCLCLSGADRPQDVRLLEASLPGWLRAIPHSIQNDVWAAFAAGTACGWGAVSISGTGHNAAVRTRGGRMLGINALKFPLGNAGGGRMLTDSALHMAFRAWEHTGPATALAAELPAACGKASLSDVLENVYKSDYTAQYAWPVPRLVDRLACQGDEVCRSLLCRLGDVQGEMLAGLMAHAGLTQAHTPVVLAGSIYQKTVYTGLYDAFAARIRAVCPGAQLTVAQGPPCAGAVLMALRQLSPGAGQKARRGWMDTLARTLAGKEVA